MAEAEVVRQALTEALVRDRRKPTIPLFPDEWGDPTLAEGVDEALTGFGDQ